MLVVDSNVLFTFFWKDSVFINAAKQAIELFAPEFAVEEIKKYMPDLLTKTKQSHKEFDKRLEELMQRVKFIPLEEYRSYFSKAESMAKDFTEEEKEEFIKDVDVFAVALKLNCPIWSNDKLFKKQDVIPVFSTKEVIELLG